MQADLSSLNKEAEGNATMQTEPNPATALNNNNLA